MSLYLPGGLPALEAPRSYSGKPITGISYQGNTTITGTPSPDSPATLTPVEPPAVPGAAKQIGPLWSLPDGTRDTYDGETGLLVRRVGKTILGEKSAHATPNRSDSKLDNVCIYLSIGSGYLPTPKNVTAISSHFVNRNVYSGGGEGIFPANPKSPYYVAVYLLKTRLQPYGLVDGDRASYLTAANAWFKAQATAGTPVTVLYELVQPTAEHVVYTGPIATRSTDILAPSWTGKTTVTGTPSPDKPANITGVPFWATATGPDGQARSVDLAATGYSLPNGAADSYDGVRGDFVQRVGRLILNGTETWTALTSIEKCFRLDPALNNIKPGTQSKMSTHFQIRANLNDFDGFSISNDGNVFLRDKSFTGGVDGLKSWLAAQAAAGTPVTIYYELAEPTAYNHKADIHAFEGQTTITGADVVEVIEGRVLRVADCLPYEIIRSNPNCLVNGYFSKPINQMAAKTYLANSKYSIDRWYLWSTKGIGSIRLDSNGITLLCSPGNQVVADQKLNDLIPNKQYTFSMLCIINSGIIRLQAFWDGNDDNFSSTGKITKSGLYFVSGTKKTDATAILRFFTDSDGSSNITVIAAKLEEGTQQTFARKVGDQWVLNDPPPDPTLELLKCQKYFLAISENSLFAGMMQGTNKSLTFFIPTPIKFEKNPAVFSCNLAICSSTGAYNTRFTASSVISRNNGVQAIGSINTEAASAYSGCTVLIKEAFILNGEL